VNKMHPRAERVFIHEHYLISKPSAAVRETTRVAYFGKEVPNKTTITTLLVKAAVLL
jgi:hypothetical protein